MYWPGSECGRKMRDPRLPLAEHPGTVAFAAHGMCGACYRAARVTPDPTHPRRVLRAQAGAERVKETLSVDEQKVLYMVLLRFTGVERDRVCDTLGLSA